GPGRTKDAFRAYLEENWKQTKPEYQTAHLSSGTSTGIQEIFKRGLVDKIAAEYSAVVAQKGVEDFEEMLATAAHRISYGFTQIADLLEQAAVNLVIVSDNIVRTRDQNQREKVESFISLCDRTRAKLLVIEDNSDIGKRISHFGGAIALLRYDVYQDAE
ncbi:MAG TPA: hypothetical protein VJ044_13160, partial [Candidatus Hodarchaeales archaeon]|nr:hypothetical protein [Candidatus Hodarchaeales archaeon]